VAAPIAPPDRARADGPVIAVIGDAALDLSFEVASFDGVDEKVEATSSLELGGTGANAAAAIVQLGGQARLHAVVARDSIGDFILRELIGRGLDTADMAIVDGRSTVAVILRSRERRLVIVDRGVADKVSHIDPAVVADGAAVVYLSAVPWAVAANVIAKSTVPVVVGLEARQLADLGAGGTPQAVAQVLDRAHVVLTNEAGAGALAEILRQLATATVVVTRGAAGAMLRVHGGPYVEVHAPAIDVVDATGAGDCFAGALCYFLAGGSRIESVVRLATIAASLSTRQRGAQAGLPGEAEVRAIFQNQAL